MTKGLKAGLIFLLAACWLASCTTTPNSSRRDVPVVNGVVHTVQDGETVDAIAKTYEISSQLLVRRNNLREGDVLQSGTRLFIPGAEEIKTVKIEESDNTIREERDGLFHRVGSGETLIAIAKAYDLSVVELQRVNNIRDVSKIYINQELWIPRAKEVKDVEITPVTIVSNDPTGKTYNDPRVEEKAEPTPTPTKTQTAQSSLTKTESNKKTQETKSPTPTPTPVEFPRKVKEFGPAKFQWPIKGSFKVLRVYNKKAGSNFNPGIDLGADIGTEVSAAAEGTVAIVGSANAPLGTGFGNYIIISHGERNNKELYTVYAHNSQNLVQVGDTVKRGQTIAKVGHTGRTSVAEGGVLHFEIREQTDHIDPLVVLPPLD